MKLAERITLWVVAVIMAAVISFLLALFIFSAIELSGYGIPRPYVVFPLLSIPSAIGIWVGYKIAPISPKKIATWMLYPAGIGFLALCLWEFGATYNVDALRLARNICGNGFIFLCVGTGLAYLITEKGKDEDATSILTRRKRESVLDSELN